MELEQPAHVGAFPIVSEEPLEQPLEAERDELPRPQVWIGTRLDWSGDRRYGDWVDAAQPLPQLWGDVRRIVERTPRSHGPRWGIYDMRGYGGWIPEESPSLANAAMVARGVVAHGAPYVALVELVGVDTLTAQPERFELSYVGSWPNEQAFIDSFLRDSGWQERMDRLPATMRPFVTLDVRRLMQEARRELTFIPHDEGLWIFDPRRW
jgi:hypothetical protein